jgi:ribokinase
MKTLVYGSLNIDFVYAVDSIVKPGETISSISMTKSAGGKGANQAAALAKAGTETYIAGKIGPDGAFLLRLLESYGVHTENVVQYEGPSGHALIQVDKNGQNSIILFAGGNSLVSPDEITRSLAAFGKNDLVLLQNEIANTGLIMKKAKERGMRIALNPSPWNEAAKSLPLNLVDILFVNEIEGSAIAGGAIPPSDILDCLTAKLSETEIILTAGKEGAYFGKGETRVYSGIVSAPVVDTTGAGDCFSGYFLAAREKGKPVKEALETASRAASITVSRKGAMESIPFKNEVELPGY